MFRGKTTCPSIDDFKIKEISRREKENIFLEQKCKKLKACGAEGKGAT